MFRRIALFALLIIVFGAWHKVAGSQVPVIVKQESRDKVKEKTRITLTNTAELNLGAGQNKLLKNNYDHISLFTVLGGIKDKKAAFQEVTCALKPGGIVSVTEMILDDPNFQTQDTVRQLAQQVGLQENACHGRPYAYTLDFKKLDSY